MKHRPAVRACTLWRLSTIVRLVCLIGEHVSVLGYKNERIAVSTKNWCADEPPQAVLTNNWCAHDPPHSMACTRLPQVRKPKVLLLDEATRYELVWSHDL